MTGEEIEGSPVQAGLGLILEKPSSSPHSPGPVSPKAHAHPDFGSRIPNSNSFVVIPLHYAPLIEISNETLIPKAAAPNVKSKKKSRRGGVFNSISQFDRRILSKGLSGRVSLREVKRACLKAHARFIKKGPISNRSCESKSGARIDEECCARKDVLADLEVKVTNPSLSSTSGFEVHQKIEAAVGFIYRPDESGSSSGVSTHNQ